VQVHGPVPRREGHCGAGVEGEIEDRPPVEGSPGAQQVPAHLQPARPNLLDPHTGAREEAAQVVLEGPGRLMDRLP